MYNKRIIRFGFCDIQNNQGLGKGYQSKPKAEADNPYQGLGKGYQPQPSASTDNSYLDLDYSGYHKNLIQ